MKKCILFSRVSTDSQDLTSQTNELIREAERHGYTDSQIIKIEYKESATTKDEDEREGIQILKDTIIRDREIDTVFCWELTRLARRADVIYSMRDFLMNHKIRWIIMKPSYTELLNSSGILTPTASLVLGIFTSFAESEMMIKKERFMRAKNELRAQGKKNAGAVIFGYMKDENKKCVPHPIHSNIIRDMFSHYAETDDSFAGTYAYLCKKYASILKPLSYKEASGKIKHWMEKEIYWKGNWCYEPIVSEEIANITIEKKKKARCVPKYNARIDFLGRGRFKCAICGNRLIGVGGRENAYVCCTDKIHSVQIKCEVADWILWDEARVIANLAAMTDRNKQVTEIQNNIDKSLAQIDNIDKEISAVKSKQDKLLNVYLNGAIDDEQFNKRNEIFKMRIQELKNQRNKITVQIAQYRNVLNNSQMFTEAKPVNFDLVNDFATKQEIIRKYIDTVLVEKLGKGDLRLSVETTMPLVRPVSVYRYIGHGHRKLIRINEDGTEDRII